MRLKWMIILKSSVLLLLYSCNKNNQSNTSNTCNFKDSLSLTFVDPITNKKLYNFKFGISTNKEELPISEILNRNKNISIVHNGIVSIKKLSNENEIYYGNFVKKGYKFNRFPLSNNSCNQEVIIMPEASSIILKASDKYVASEIDSVDIVFEYKKPKYRNRELYKCRKSEIDSNLEYFNKYIEYNESVKLHIMVFEKGQFYEIIRFIEYEPWTNTVINLI